MDDVLDTRRLRLVPLADSHATALFDIFRDPTTLEYWHHPPHQSVSETEDMVAAMIGGASPVWTIIHKATERPIGLITFIRAAVPGMGYIVAKDYWKQGYGTEAASAALTIGFQALGFDRLELWIDERNLASQRLAARLGFKGVGRFYQHYPHRPQPHETRVFGLRFDQWASQLAMMTPAHRENPFLNVHPVLPVANVADAVAFYCNQLGFLVEFTSGNPPEFAIVSRGEWTTERVHLHLKKADAVSPVHLYVTIGGSADHLRDEFSAKHVTIIHPPTTQPYGLREFTIADNSGHQITFGARI